MNGVKTNMESSITIPVKFYLSLIEKAKELQYLENFGVDSWEGYSEAMQAIIDDELRNEDGYDEHTSIYV